MQNVTSYSHAKTDNIIIINEMKVNYNSCILISAGSWTSMTGINSVYMLSNISSHGSQFYVTGTPQKVDFYYKTC